MYVTAEFARTIITPYIGLLLISKAERRQVEAITLDNEDVLPVAVVLDRSHRATAELLAPYQMPPRATVTASPLMPFDASLHRNTIVSATSRGVRTRRTG